MTNEEAIIELAFVSQYGYRADKSIIGYAKVNEAFLIAKKALAKQIPCAKWKCFENHAICSECSKEIEFNESTYANYEVRIFAYCPFCGAKMGTKSI